MAGTRAGRSPAGRAPLLLVLLGCVGGAAQTSPSLPPPPPALPPKYPPTPPPPPPPLFAELRLVLISNLASVGTGSSLLASLSASLRFPLNRLRIISTTEVSSADFWSESATRRLSQISAYVQARVGFEQADGTSAKTDADQYTLDTLVLLLSAAVNGDTPSLALSIPYLPSRSTVCSVRDNGVPFPRCTNQTADAAILFSATPPPMLPPASGPISPPAPSSPAGPAPPPDMSMLAWLIPVIVVSSLLLLCFIALNAYCFMRLMRSSQSSARVNPISDTSSASGKVRIGRGFKGGKGGDDDDDDDDEEDGKKKSRRRKKKQDKGSGDEEGTEDDDASDDDEDSEDVPARSSSRKPPQSPSNAAASPRGRQYSAARGGASIAYEPPSALLGSARLVVGPCGKPTYTLPPIHSTSPTRRSTAVPRGGFSDAPPPELLASRGSYSPGGGAPHSAPKAMGPAPWIPELSPQRRSPQRRSQLPPLWPQGGPGNYSPAGAPGYAPSTAAARARMRGNVTRQRFDEVVGSPAMAGPGAEMTQWPQQEMAMSPGAASLPIGERPAVSFAPAPKAMPAPAPAAKKVEAKKDKSKAKEKAPAAELALAERARERVRSRREERAKSEAAP